MYVLPQTNNVQGPQGCGKTINAPGLCKAFGVSKWVDADDLRYQRQSMPAEDHIIFAIDWPKDTQGLPCVNFAFAISKVDKPHPMTPKAAEA